MSPNADPGYSVDELMVAALARQFEDSDQACNGAASFLPVCAIQLARATHAPNLVWLAGAVGLDARPRRVPASTLESPLWHRSAMYMPQFEDFWSYVLNGRWLTKFCVRGAQIDRFGNANNSVIGSDYHHPKVRLPGSAGLADMGSIGKRLIFWTTTHNQRTFVEKVDFITCAGYLGGGDERDRLGLTGGSHNRRQCDSSRCIRESASSKSRQQLGSHWSCRRTVSARLSLPTRRCYG